MLPQDQAYELLKFQTHCEKQNLQYSPHYLSDFSICTSPSLQSQQVFKGQQKLTKMTIFDYQLPPYFSCSSHNCHLWQ